MTAPSLPTRQGLDPAVLKNLSDEERQRLLALVATAGRLQEIEYHTAFDQALKHVPALLRRTLRNMILG